MIGSDHLYFYDAIAPIVAADSLHHDRLFRASRYGKGGDDYLNCPLTEEEYGRFRRNLLDAGTIELRDFERPLFFEGLPCRSRRSRAAAKTPCASDR